VLGVGAIPVGGVKEGSGSDEDPAPVELGPVAGIGGTEGTEPIGGSGSDEDPAPAELGPAEYVGVILADSKHPLN